MLRWAIPQFRLPLEVLNRDIDYIRRMGIAIRTNVRFGADELLSSLKKKGACAVLLSIGTQQGLKLGIKNEKPIYGSLDCLDFLKRYAAGQSVTLSGRVLVIGGGNAAVDTARIARRCGASDVRILYRRSSEEMPADKDEVARAVYEGINICYLTTPIRFISVANKVAELECVQTELGQPDSSGRRTPVPIRGSEYVLEAETVINAIGQQPDLSWNQDRLPFSITPSNTFLCSEDGMTTVDGVFAAGDCVTGPTTVIEAMASGRRVAAAIYDYLCRK
jgi:heterodisulfide reductase subunit A